MTSRYYDAIVLGRSLGALAAAALLARRDFRVLLLGQGQRPATYRFERHVLRRRASTLLAGSSPVWHRILHELAQSPRFRRRTRALDPMFVMLTEGRRIEVPPDMELFAREVDREYPEVRQLVDELYTVFAHANASADVALERDAVWPPGTLWERVETGRVASTLPFVGAEAQHDPLGKFPMGHPYRDLVTIPARFASDLWPSGEQLPPFALARLHGAWTRGVQAFGRGEDEICEFLIERIEAHGGECRLDGRASSLVVRGGKVAGVLEAGEDELSGSVAVLSNQSGEAIAELANGEGITSKARREWPRLTAAAGRFVVSLVVRREGLPEPLGEEAFVLPAIRGRPDPRRPTVHLQYADRDLDAASHERRDETLLVAETLMPTRGPLTALEAREAVLATLREHLPFLERHLVVVDSTHDGLPLWQYTDGVRREIDRIHVQSAGPGAESMNYVWSVEPLGYLDLCGEPVRGPISGTYLVGRSVVPALGQEGEFLAAWSAARIVTRKDRTRQKMRRRMWNKIETG